VLVPYIVQPTAGAGLTFSVPYLYDGVSFAGVPKFVECADQRSTTGNCTGLRICVQSNTTHVQVVESLFPDPSVTLVSPTTPAFYSNFVLGYCNVLAGEQFDLAITNVRQAGYNGNYSFSSNLYSKEPIALVTRDDDVEWSDFVNWVFLALLTAETKTIFQTTAQATVNNPAPIVDLAQLPFYAAVAEVGNYGEVYARYLQTIVPRAPANELNNGSTPLIYSFPFGNTSTLGPGPVVNGTLEKILKRGYLLCGTAETLFFANFNSTAQEWEGFDVDYCRAVSAAVFNGTGSTVFVPITDTDRWEKLVNGDIDLISWDTTWNYQRDVDEPSTNTGFTFTQPDFYSGLQFGGTPS
jgi:ABC-type amino acid transport substrate-binding protein